MALEASHIRFALDLKEALKVSDVERYVSGSIYPDSRYVTGVDRMATHPKEYRDDPMFQTTDFHKGWFVHLWCDDIQADIMKDMLPETSEGDGTESWLKRSAIKNLQDIDDASKFELSKYLKCLEYVENPNGEDIDVIRTYNRIFPAMYADPAHMTINDTYEMWRKFGIGDELAGKMKALAEKYSADESVMHAVELLYDEMVTRGKAAIQ